MKELIEKLNISDETRAELGEELTGEQIETILAEHNKSLFDQHREALANDDDFTGKYRDKGYRQHQAKTYDDFSKAVKELGYEGELTDDKGNKPPHVILKEWYSKMEEKLSKSGKGSDKDRQELMEVSRKFKELQEAVEAGSLPAIAEARAELDELKAARDREQANSWLSGFLKTSEHYKIDRSKVLRLVADDLRSAGYKIGRTEEGAFSILDGNDRQPMSEDKTRVLKAEEIVSRFENDYIAQSNGTKDKKTTTVTTETPTFEKSRMTKRQQAAAERLKQIEASK